MHGIALLVLLALVSRGRRTAPRPPTPAPVPPAPGPGPTPPPTPPPPPQLNPSTGKPIVTAGSHHLSPDELRALVVARGFKDVDKAVALAQRESGGWSDVYVDTRGMTADQLQAYWHKPAAPELSVGLWQINILANAALIPGDTTDAKLEALKDPKTNASVAYALSNGGTAWGPWGG